MENAQKWLDKNYPKNGICQKIEKRMNGGVNEGYSKRKEEVKHLDISYENLEGSFCMKIFFAKIK